MGSSKKKPASSGGAHSNLPPEVAAAKAELIDVENKRTALVEELRLVEKQVRGMEVMMNAKTSFFYFSTSSLSLSLLAPPHLSSTSKKKKKIYDLETRYLATANPAGTALKGYDGLLSSSGGVGGAGGGGGGGGAGRRPAAVKPEERVFSRSSTTGQPPGAK